MMTRRLLIGLMLLSGTSWAASWRMHRGFSDRTGRALEEASPPLIQAWSAYVAGPVFASPLVVGTRILVGTENGDVVALSESGVELWRRNLGAAIRSTPAVRDGRVYVPVTNGTVGVLDLVTGALIYQVAVGGADGASPVLADDRLIGGGGYPDSSMYAVTIATGGVVWRFNPGQPVLASPAVGPDYIVAAAGTGQVYRLKLNGAPVWQSTAPTGAMYYVTPLVANGLAYASGGGYDRTVVAYDLATGARRWSYTMVAEKVPSDSGYPGDKAGDGPNDASSAATDGPRVFVVGGYRTPSYIAEQRLYALDALTGAQLWHTSVGSATGRGFAASPVVAQDVVYAAGGNTLWAFTLSSGGPLGSWPVNGGIIASPAVANGRVYVGTLNGFLYAYDAALAVAVRSPDHGDLIRGATPVMAVIHGHAPTSVQVEYAAGRKKPEEGGYTSLFSAVPSSGDAVAVGTWPTNALPPGDYTVRVTVSDTQGRTARAVSYVQGTLELAKKRIVAADGGRVTAPDGTFVDIPAGGLSADSWVTINQAGDPLQDGRTVGTAVREILLDSGVTLTKRATLSIPYLATDAADKRPDYFRIYWYNPAAQAWQAVNTSLPRPAENRVESQVTHLSVFRVQQYAPREKLLYPDEVYTYPNPAKSVAKLTFKFLLGDQADVTIKVFNVAGEQVGELAGSYDASAAGLTQSLDWNLGGVASGVYYYRVEAKNGSRSDSVTKKLAVIQ